MDKLNAPRQISGVVTYRDFSTAPIGLFDASVGVLTQSAGTLTNLGVWLGGRSAVQTDLGTTNASTQAIQSEMVRFSEVGDYARITGAVYFPVVADCGLFVGLATTDTTVCNDTISSLPTDFVGLHKVIAGTTFSLAAGDDGSTESVAVPITIAATTWYDFCIEVYRTGTNTADIRAAFGVSSVYDGQYLPASNPVVLNWKTTKLPDADADVRFTWAYIASSTDNVSPAATNVSFLFAKGNV